MYYFLTKHCDKVPVLDFQWVFFYMTSVDQENHFKTLTKLVDLSHFDRRTRVVGLVPRK